MKESSVSKHLIFSGNPGTGKTNMAKFLSKIYIPIGIEFSRDHLDFILDTGGQLVINQAKCQDIFNNISSYIYYRTRINIKFTAHGNLQTSGFPCAY